MALFFKNIDQPTILLNKNGEIFNYILDLIENKDKMPKFDDDFKQKLFNEEIKYWGL